MHSTRYNTYHRACGAFASIVPICLCPTPGQQWYQCRELEPTHLFVACARGEIVELAKRVDEQRGILPAKEFWSGSQQVENYSHDQTRETAMRDVSSSKQRYLKFPPQDPYPRRKPGDVPRMPPGYHTSQWPRRHVVVSSAG